MAERLVQHVHCRNQNCGKAISPEDEYCDDKCKRDWEDFLKKKRYQNIGLFIVGAIVLLFTLFFGW